MSSPFTALCDSIHWTVKHKSNPTVLGYYDPALKGYEATRDGEARFLVTYSGPSGRLLGVAELKQPVHLRKGEVLYAEHKAESEVG